MGGKSVIAASLPLSGCALDTSDSPGISLLVIAVLLVAPFLIYPPLKVWLDQRELRRRMDRTLRVSQATGIPAKALRKRRARRPKGA